MRDLNDKSTGDTLTAEEFDELASELQNVVEAFYTLSTLDLEQLEKAIALYSGAAQYYQESGAADTYVLSGIGTRKACELLNANTDGIECRFRPGNANTGASTVNVNGTGAKAIVREGYGALSGGELVTTRDAVIRYRYSNDDWILAEYCVPGTTDVSRGYIDGLVTAQAADPDHDITFGTGVARDAANSYTINLTSALTKQIDQNWAAGNNQGGFPSLLTLTLDTWYHLFVIANPTTGAVDAGFDSNITASNLLTDATGYTKYRRVGSVRTDGSVLIQDYRQSGDRFIWEPSRQVVVVTNPGTSEVTHTLSHVPTGLRVFADLAFVHGTPNYAGTAYFRVGGGDVTLSAAASSAFDGRIGDNADGNHYCHVSKLVLTNLSAQVKSRTSYSDGTTTTNAQCHGWLDPRGKNG